MKKILVIFSFALIVILIIFSNKKSERISLLISENSENYQTTNVFRYEKITYKELIKSIKSNDSIVVKNKRIYLNQLISKSNILYLNINNKEFEKKCKKNKSYNYNEYIKDDINDLIKLIKRISTCEIIIIVHNCNYKYILNDINDIYNNVRIVNIDKK